MTLSIKIAGASFTKTLIASRPAIFNSARMFSLLGGDEESSIRHRAEGAAARVVGSPIYAAGYATLDAANGFEATAAAAGQPFTYMGVFTAGSGGSSVVHLGGWTAATPRHGLTSLGGVMRLAVDGAPRVTAAAGAGMRFFAGTHDGVTARLYTGAAGSVAKAEAEFSGGGQTSVFRAGATGTGGAISFDMAAVAYWSAVLSDAQIASAYAYLKDALALRGVSVA